MSLTRKQFLSSMIGVVAGAAGAALFVGCASDDDDGDGGGDNNCLANGTTVTIQSNHGHTLTVSIADVTAGVEKSYNIKGGADHSHTVVVTAALFTTLKANTAIMVTSSSDDGHSHGVSIGCA
jgi:hypothetical protein